MLVGLGTGSTAAFVVEALGQRVREGCAITAVATSQATERAAMAAGIPMRDLAAISAIDLCIDGIDEIDPQFRAIKGAGGAMLREKVVAAAATRALAIGDASKAVAQLGTRPVPLEVLPLARAFVAAQVEKLGGVPALRRDRRGEIALTDQQNVIIDCQFEVGADFASLASQFDAVPGLLGHGLFLVEIDALYLADDQGVTRTERVSEPAGRESSSSHGPIVRLRSFNQDPRS